MSAFQSGRFTDGGSSNIGVATSTDAGATWTKGFLPGTTIYANPPGQFARISDPSVAYDAAHATWLIVSLPLRADTSSPSVLASRSTDGGLTWANPVVVQQATGSQEPSAPHPVGHRRVHQQGPQADEHQVTGELHPLGKGTRDQRRGDDGEGHLEAHEHRLRDGRGQGIGGVDRHAGQHHPAEAAEIRR